MTLATAFEEWTRAKLKAEECFLAYCDALRHRGPEDWAVHGLWIQWREAKARLEDGCLALAVAHSDAWGGESPVEAERREALEREIEAAEAAHE